MNRCACVLIPLRLDSDQVLGASVLVEALSLQKPVVTTRQGLSYLTLKKRVLVSITKWVIWLRLCLL